MEIAKENACWMLCNKILTVIEERNDVGFVRVELAPPPMYGVQKKTP
jgi:hypothetical protein